MTPTGVVSAKSPSGPRRVLTAVAAGLGAASLPVATVSAAGSAGAPQVQVVESYPHGYIEATAAPGDRITAHLHITDGGAVPATFLVTPVDGYTSPASGVVYGNRQQALRDGPSGNGEWGAGGWINVSEPQVSLIPGGSATVTVSVAVPADVKAGDWVGAVTVENPVPDDSGSGGTQLHVTEATAIAVVMHVPGNPSPGTFGLEQPQVVVDGAQEFLRVRVVYTGDVLVKPFYSFSVRDSTGRTVYTHAGQFDSFMPHTTMEWESRIDPPLAPGDYVFNGGLGRDASPPLADIALRAGALPAPIPAAQPPSLTAPSTRSWLWLLAPGASGVALLLLLIVLLRGRRRCSHCNRGRFGTLMEVQDFHEIARCKDCRRRALERESVRLCADCYRSHVLPMVA